MITDDYPDDCVTPAPPGGRPPLVLGALAFDAEAFEEEEEEDEETESSEAASGYGSLLGLGLSARKKKPMIVIDPVEAENEARRVQFIAAQQLVDPDAADGIEFREAPALFPEPEPSPAEAGFSEGFESEPETEGGQALPDGRDGEVLELEPSVEAVQDSAEADAEELAIAVEGLARIYETHGLESLPVAEPEQDETQRPQPLPVPAGHSLRARMPTQAPQRTFGDQVLAILARLRDWLARPR